MEEAEQLLSFAIGLQEDYKQGKSGGTCRRQENQDFKQSGKGFEKERIRGYGRFLFNQEANSDKTEKVKVYQEKKSQVEYTGPGHKWTGESDKNGADDGRQHHNLVIKTPSTHSSAQPERSLQKKHPIFSDI